MLLNISRLHVVHPLTVTYHRNKRRNMFFDNGFYFRYSADAFAVRTNTDENSKAVGDGAFGAIVEGYSLGFQEGERQAVNALERTIVEICRDRISKKAFLIRILRHFHKTLSSAKSEGELCRSVKILPNIFL